MKKLLFVLAIVFFVPFSAYSYDQVRGHWRDTDGDGYKDTYVDTYQRTSPNRTKADNYDYPGNYNPNTGRTSTGSEDNYNYNSYYKTKKRKSSY
ncbi:MAG: hypothetical protein ABFD76_05230 [Smithella sp.]